MKTALRQGRIVSPVYGLKALTDEGPGIHEAIVAVFGNVDFHGDRIIAGAFSGFLSRLEASHELLPVIFSHQWNDLASHIGYALEAKELLPGDERLPTELRALGGLWVKFRLDVDDEKTWAPTIDRHLNRRTIKEFSFAYDVLDERRGSDGANELLELDVFEVGPTLKGANPSTALLSKGLGDEATRAMFRELATKAGADGDALLAELDELVKTVAHAFAPGDEDESRCILCGLTRNTVAHNANAADPDGTKAWVTLAGSMEERQEAAYAAACEWAADQNVGDGGFYCAYLEATYDDRIVILVEGWNDPPGVGEFYELDYTIGDDGKAEVASPRLVAVEATTVAKSRGMKHRRGLATEETKAADRLKTPAALDAAVLSELDDLILSDVPE